MLAVPVLCLPGQGKLCQQAAGDCLPDPPSFHLFCADGFAAQLDLESDDLVVRSAPSMLSQRRCSSLGCLLVVFGKRSGPFQSVAL